MRHKAAKLLQTEWSLLKAYFGNLSTLQTRLLIAGAVVIAGAVYIQQAHALTGTIYPDGDVTRGFTPTPTGCTATTHYACIDETTNSTTDYVNTGTGGTTGETEEYTFSTIANTNVTITSFTATVYANSVACLGNSTNCDQITVSIYKGGALLNSAVNSLTTTNTSYTVTANGTWTTDTDIQVRVQRTRVGGGSAASADDDVRITSVKTDVTYTNNILYAQSSYRFFSNDNTQTVQGNFAKLADPPNQPLANGYASSFSPDGTYLTLGSAISPYITIYKRSGDTFTKLSDPATLPSAAVYSTAFSSDGVYLAVGSNVASGLTIYKRSGDTFTKLSDPATMPANAVNAVSFSSDGTYLAVGANGSSGLTIYKRSGDTFTKLSDPATMPSNGYGTAFSPDGTYLSVVHFASPYVTIYKRSGDTFTKLSNPATLPAGSAEGTAFSPDGTYLSVAHSTSPYVTIYKRSGDTFTKLSDPATLPAGIAHDTAFSPDGQFMSVAHETSPYITIYQRSGDTFTKLSNPATLPVNGVESVAFSPSSGLLAASSISPGLLVYKSSGTANIGSTLAAQDTAATAPGTGTPFRLRMDLHVSGSQANVATAFKLQVAPRGADNVCDTSFSGESYTDVSSVSGSLRYYDNTNLDDAQPFTINASDPTHSSDTLVRQTYGESNNFSVATAIPAGQDGMWDFSLVRDPSASPGSYCVRVVKSDGSLLDTYSVIPEIIFSLPVVGQANYRWFANANNINPGAALVAQDTAATVASQTPVRLRQRLDVNNGDIPINNKNYKLQYAQKITNCDPSVGGETYLDVGGTAANASGSPAVTDISTDASGDTSWSGTGTLQSVDGLEIKAASKNAFATSHYAIAKDFGFNIPSSASIRGVEVNATRRQQTVAFTEISEYSIKLVKNSVIGGSDLVHNLEPWDSALATGWGGPAELWGQSWSPSDINSSGFGFAFKVGISSDGSNSISAFTDDVTIAVYYVDSSGTEMVAYSTNGSVSSGSTISSIGGDPTNAGRPTVYQEYRSNDPFSNSVASISSGSDGLWDYSLTTNTSAQGKTLCFRVVDMSNGLLNSYTQYPQLTVTASGPTLDQQLRGGQSVLGGVKQPFSW